MYRRLVLLFLLWVSACRSLDVPTPPGAGVIQGILTYAGPGGELVVAGGASVELLGTSLKTTADSTSGFFRLTPVPLTHGTLLIRYDADKDGLFDHNRSLGLDSIQAGPGRSVSLGTMTLSGNASIRGTVLRSDALVSASGHGGANVFIPEGPYLAYTGDNGGFSLDGLPEGDVTLAFFRAGYLSQQTSVNLAGGQTLSIPTIILAVDASAAVPVPVSGSATLFGQSSSEGVTVTASGGTSTTTAADGTWSMNLLPSRYVFGFTKEGYETVTLRNIAVTGANFQVSPVVLTPGASTTPDLDVGSLGGGGGGTGGGGAGGAGGGTGGGTGGGNGRTDGGGDGTDGGSSGAFDAGVIDAGVDAGAVDAGQPLLAVIDPLPPYKGFSSATQLSGVHSSGGTRPYLYRWAQTRGTPAVTITPNNSTAAATPTFYTPSSSSSPTVLGFTLTVVDALDAGSPPSAEVTLPVGNPPTASIVSPQTTVYPGQQLVLDGSGSTDSGGTGIVQYFWTVSPAGLVTMGTATGQKLTLTMPSSVAVPQALTVALTVTNGVGIQGSTSTTLALASTAAPGWTVDAGPGQTVRDGQVVTLTGVATAPGVPGATFTYRWSPAASDGGAPWALQDPTSPTTTFIAPMVVGPNVLLNFTLTATSTSGLSPPQMTSTTFVNVLDRTSPTVVATSISALGRAGLLGLNIDFSEPVDPASLGSVSINPGAVIDRILTNNNTRVYLVTNPIIDGNSYSLSVAGVRDPSPQGNALSSVSYPFVAQRMVSPAFESTDTSTTDPRPGLVLRPGSVPNSVEALVFGRRGTTPWFLMPIDPASCSSAPCPVATDTSAPAPAMTPTLVRGNRGLRLGNTAYATLQPRDFFYDAPAAVFARPGNSWVALSTPPPGSLVTDGTKLYSVYVENGLKVGSYDAATGTWGTSSPNVASTDATLFSTSVTADAGANPAPEGAMSNPLGVSYTYLASKVSNSNDVRAYQLTTLPSTWSAFGPWTNTVDHRILTANQNGWLFYSTPSAVSGAGLYWTLFGNANNSDTISASGASGFDGMARGSASAYNVHVWYAASVDGLIRVKMMFSGSGQWTTVLGPGGVDAMNNSTDCFADSPEFAQLYDKVGIAWSEQCAGGPWKMYFRLLN